MLLSEIILKMNGPTPKKKSLPAGDVAALKLLARGDCYNPQCSEPLITKRAGRLIVNYEIAHIRDELPPRSEPADIGRRMI